jgi:hypothetical protein
MLQMRRIHKISSGIIIAQLSGIGYKNALILSCSRDEENLWYTPQRSL